MRQLTLSPREEKLLKTISFSTHTHSKTVTKGAHGSEQAGSNVEFKEYKSYAPGDDIKSIDWKVAARTERLHIRTFHEDVSLTGISMLDVSASMEARLPDSSHSKIEAGILYLFYLTHAYYFNREVVGMIEFNNGVLGRVAPGHSPTTYRNIFKTLEKTSLKEGQTDFRISFEKSAPFIPRKSRVTVVSDFFCDAGHFEKAILPLLERRVELEIIRVIDPYEIHFLNTCKRPVLFIDSESQRKQTFYPSALNKYKDMIERHRAEMKSLCANLKIRYVEISTDKNIFHQFLALNRR